MHIIIINTKSHDIVIYLMHIIIINTKSHDIVIVDCDASHNKWSWKVWGRDREASL